MAPRTTTRPRGTRRVLAPALAAALLLPVTAAPATADTDPATAARAAAGWLATQLVDGERMEVRFGDDVFPDQGLTADVVFALASAGVGGTSVAAASAWLETQAEVYTRGFGIAAGATAKLALALDAAGRDVTAAGGLDLPTQLLGLESAQGRFVDDSEFGDFSNTITQSLGLLALERTTASGPSDLAIAYLAGQACDDGGFPIELDQDTCTSNVDGTAFAVQALAAVDADATVVTAAAAWLLSVQGSDGAFSGPDGTNANSTGLAAVALDLGGEVAAAAAARAWLIDIQDGCDDPDPGAIPFNPDTRGDVARATAQALPGLAGVSLAAVTATGIAPDAPLLDCPAGEDDGPDAPDTGDDTDAGEAGSDAGEGGSDGEAGDDATASGPRLPATGADPYLPLLGSALLLFGIVLLRRHPLAVDRRP